MGNTGSRYLRAVHTSFLWYVTRSELLLQLLPFQYINISIVDFVCICRAHDFGYCVVPSQRGSKLQGRASANVPAWRCTEFYPDAKETPNSLFTFCDFYGCWLCLASAASSVPLLWVCTWLSVSRNGSTFPSPRTEVML